MGMLINNVEDLNEAYEQKSHTSVGGYPLYFVMADGESLCVRCAVAKKPLIEEAVRDQDKNSTWLTCGIEVNWKDPALFCAHCNERIESAYAEPEEGEDV